MNDHASVAVAINAVDNYTKKFRQAVDAARRNSVTMAIQYKHLSHLDATRKQHRKWFDAIGAGKRRVVAQLLFQPIRHSRESGNPCVMDGNPCV